MNESVLAQLRQVETECAQRNVARRFAWHLIVSSFDLRRWNRAAKSQVLSDKCLARLDLKGSHVVRVIDEKDDELVLQVMMKFHGQEQPEDGLLSVSASDFAMVADKGLKLVI